jgi:hypothetical protein
VRTKLDRVLLGAGAAKIEGRTRAAVWRAGCLRAVTFAAKGSRGPAILADLFAMPAARWLTRLTVERLDSYEALQFLHKAVQLRDLTLTAEFHGQYTLDSAQLDPLPNLRALRVDQVRDLAVAPCLARLRSLALSTADTFAWTALSVPGWSSLETLDLDLSRTDELPTKERFDELARACSRLRVLHLRSGKRRGRDRFEQLTESLASSELVHQLAHVGLGEEFSTRPVSTEIRKTLNDGAFAHLKVLELPHRA